MHIIPVPSARPWKTHALARALADVPAGAVPAVAMLREAQPSYGLVAFLKATGVPWLRPTQDDQELENALAAHPENTAPLLLGRIAMTGSVLHPATHGTRIGEHTARMLEPFHVVPLRTGDTEPLSWPWDTVANSHWFRSQMPWASLIFSGPNVTGLLTAVRTESGVLESFDALVTTGTPVSETLRNSALEKAAALNSTDFSLEHHFGADPMGVHPGADGFRVPLAALAGPGIAKSVNLRRRSIEGVDVESLGTPPFQHLAIRFPMVTAWDHGHGQELRQELFQTD
ncbi:hypothetical protein [Arthrobacter pascens]|uniref:hypothetical protein n=1 Tax=Arthrobacter pascens TaxID=1677 RepID=UPI0027D83B4D|nr:hypothetical protein [Arthrobacter pascens]